MPVFNRLHFNIDEGQKIPQGHLNSSIENKLSDNAMAGNDKRQTDKQQ